MTEKGRLTVTRRVGEKIVIQGGITIEVIGAWTNRVKLTIEAPRDIQVLRAELAQESKE